MNDSDMEVFRKDGEFWTLEFDGTVVHLRDVKGLRYMARLLAAPDQPQRASDLLRNARTGRVQADPTDSEAAPDTMPIETCVEAGERARSAVTKRIKDAIRKIHACHPVLGRHLMRTVHTGYACVYRSDPDRPTHWVLS